MKEKVTPNPQKATTQDAEIVAEVMAADSQSAPEIDFEDDYELAQEMSHSPEEITTAEEE